MRTPCQEGDAEDWFITRAGTQYGDEPLVLTPDEAHETMERYAGETWDVVEVGISLAIERKRAAALLRRRRAREACGPCPVRAQCLELALGSHERHGTWGGVYEEQIRKFQRKRARWLAAE